MSEWILDSVEYVPGDEEIGEFWYEVKAHTGEHLWGQQGLAKALAMSYAEKIQHGYTVISVTLWLQADVRIAKFEVSGMTVRSKDVNSTLLRAIPIQLIADSALEEMEKRGMPGLSPMFEITESARASWPKDKDKAAAMAAEIYRQAMLRRIPPVEEVQRQFDVSKSTATRIVAHARKAGYLLIEPVHKSKRKAQEDGTEEATDR